MNRMTPKHIFYVKRKIQRRVKELVDQSITEHRESGREAKDTYIHRAGSYLCEISRDKYGWSQEPEINAFIRAQHQWIIDLQKYIQTGGTYTPDPLPKKESVGDWIERMKNK